ncbi:hypothetical protein [Sinorhizobium meliloti]|uniref:hypothetical protein n=1 Tax=Rhizobium meliloti TaxID=382 RepID=UPI00191499AA|nr:hypothetical protein [Sinorhizobium meliloti]
MSHSDLKRVDKSIETCPITFADVARVAQFLHDELNGRIPPEAWAAAIQPSWQMASPNHGFMLVCGDRVLGVYLAFYSQRLVEGRLERFCNLAAWCVTKEYRSHGLKLLRAVLAQDGYTFTDLSPSGNVVSLNARLNFQHLDTATMLVPNWPWPRWATRTSVISDPTSIECRLQGRDLDIYRDHAHAAAAHHLVVLRDNEYCYVIFRRDRRKSLPLFASILHVGNPELFQKAARHVYSYFLTRFGVVATLVEERVAGCCPRFSVALRSPRPKMFRSSRLEASQIDYLYSELTCVPW